MFTEGRVRFYLLKNTRYSVVFCGLQYLAIASSKVRDCTDLVVCIEVYSQMQILQEAPVLSLDYKAPP